MTDMYFVKIKRNRAAHKPDYVFYTECAKGKLWLNPSYGPDRGWHWYLELWSYRKMKNLQSILASPPNNELVKIFTYRNGGCKSLYLAAVTGLQHLLGCRRQPLYKLLRALANNQALYQLGKLGA